MADTYSLRLSSLFAPNDMLRARHYADEFFSSHCTNIRLMSIRDRQFGVQRLIPVSCGYCDNCRNKQSNDWFSRIWLHLQDFHYCYYVTLTYAPIYLHEVNVQAMSEEQLTSQQFADVRAMLKSMDDAVWHLDDFNSDKTLGFHPCLLRYAHFQKYMKRLRALCPDARITYMSVGEYGSHTEYGRPHWHALIFSDKQLCDPRMFDVPGRDRRKQPWLSPFHKAWQFGTRKCGYCYVEDLVDNGTTTSSGEKKDGTVQGCMKYLTKYLHKGEFPSSRVRLAWHVMHGSIRSKELLTYHKLNKKYEKALSHFVPGSFCGAKGTKPSATCDSIRELRAEFANDRDGFGDFKHAFAPCHHVSTSTPLGRLFYDSHLAEFLAGNKNLPQAPAGAVTFPRYFQRKIREGYLPYGFINHETPSGAPTFIQADMPFIIKTLSRLPEICAHLPVLTRPLLTGEDPSDVDYPRRIHHLSLCNHDEDGRVTVAFSDDEWQKHALIRRSSSPGFSHELLDLVCYSTPGGLVFEFDSYFVRGSELHYLCTYSVGTILQELRDTLSRYRKDYAQSFMRSFAASADLFSFLQLDKDEGYGLQRYCQRLEEGRWDVQRKKNRYNRLKKFTL